MIDRIDFRPVSEQTLRSRVFSFSKHSLENTMLSPLNPSGFSRRVPSVLIYGEFQPLAHHSSLTIIHKILWTPVFVFGTLHINPHKAARDQVLEHSQGSLFLPAQVVM
jgi:hypothetical protein